MLLGTSPKQGGFSELSPSATELLHSSINFKFAFLHYLFTRQLTEHLDMALHRRWLYSRRFGDPHCSLHQDQGSPKRRQYSQH